MEIDQPDHTSQAENANQDQTDIDQPETSPVENDYQDQIESDQPEMMQGENAEMRQGEDDYQVVQPLIDHTEIEEISQADNIDNREVNGLGAKLIDGAQKTEFFFSSPCIYRVPNELRKLKKSAYTPHVIAIGPLHRKDPHLQTPMQLVKMSYTNNLVCRVSEVTEGQESAEQKNLTVLRKCMEAIKASLDDAKKCYAEEVKLDVEMMLVDGCFILEFLYRNYWRLVQLFQLDVERVPPNSKAADPIFVNSSTCITVQHDLVLLENQIPFSVLERLFSLTLARLHNNLSLSDYVVLPKVVQLMRPQEGKSTNRSSTETSCCPRDCIVWVSGNKNNTSKPEEKAQSEEVVSSHKEDSTNTGSPKTSCWPRDCIRWVSGNKTNNSKPEEKVPLKEPSEPKVSSGNAKSYHHLLHKVHDDFVPQDQPEKAQDDLTELLPSASDLDYAGVKFIRGTGDDLFKVKFIEPEGLFWWYHRACFEIPFLLVDDKTESVLRNLIAFEQCCPGQSKHFSSYALLMDMLVNYDTDVQVLEKAGVLRNYLGAANDVTQLFNKLSKEVSYEEFFFAETCNKAIKYRKCFWPKNLAQVRRTYFASPWTVIAFCLGFIAFGITITNFIRGFLA